MACEVSLVSGWDSGGGVTSLVAAWGTAAPRCRGRRRRHSPHGGARASRDQRKTTPEEWMPRVCDFHFSQVVYQWVVDRGMKLFDPLTALTMRPCSPKRRTHPPSAGTQSLAESGSPGRLAISRLRPQGRPKGDDFPVLALIALHGMDEAITRVHPQARVIAYADDCVVLHEDCRVVEHSQQLCACGSQRSA